MELPPIVNVLAVFFIMLVGAVLHTCIENSVQVKEVYPAPHMKILSLLHGKDWKVITQVECEARECLGYKRDVYTALIDLEKKKYIEMSSEEVDVVLVRLTPVGVAYLQKQYTSSGLGA